MPRSTRARIRSSQSQSLSLSQPTTRKTRATAAIKERVEVEIESQDEGHNGESHASFGSASTATLPERYKVSACVTPGQEWSTTEQEQLHVKGAEFISDGWRRGEPEGNVSQLRAMKRRRRAGIGLEGTSNSAVVDKEEDPLDLQMLWYSAPFIFPHIEDFPTNKSRWSPRYVPPLSASLPILNAQDRNLVPLVGNDIPLWSHSPMQDLDPVQDELQEFLWSWREADGSGWGDQVLLHSNIKNGNWSFECDDAVHEADTSGSADLFAPPENVKTVVFNLKRPLPAESAKQTSAVELEVGTRSPAKDLAAQVETGVVIAASSAGEDWNKESKRRKKWWRDHITKEEGYNTLWDIIPRPHALQPRLVPRRSKITRVSGARIPPDYKLSRFYSGSSPHPFHPDLSAYIATNPQNRVYWAIPIIGPVHVPGWYDPSALPKEAKAPIPSSAKIAPFETSIELPSDSPEKAKASRHKRRDLRWTPSLLAHFWTAFLVPLHQDPSFVFGAISLRLSGPKPDPYLALPSPPPFPPWPYPPATAPSPAVHNLTTPSTPVRPEMGDHIRLYCDLKYALAIRTWLHAIEVDLAQVNPGNTAPNQENMFRPFEKARLVLVGHRGEALVVA